MQRNTAKFLREKAVLISVYEEKPRRRSVSASSHHHHHHHHHYHHYYLRDVCAGKGYNRRAELLHYSQSLRESPPPPPPAAALAPLQPKQKPKPKPKSKPTTSNNQQPTDKTVAVQRKASSAKTPTCFGYRKGLIPSFFRSFICLAGKKDKLKKKQSGPGTKKMKALIKSIEVRKKRGFIPRLCSTSKLQPS